MRTPGLVDDGTSALLLRDPQRRGKVERVADLRDRISGYPPRLDLCAGLAAVERMLETLLIEALEAEARRRDDPCWIRALADPGLGEALRHIHAKPGHAWTNAVLARRSGLHDQFEQQFERRVGCKPQLYLGRWRMELAAQTLAGVPDPSQAMLEALAVRLGFASAEALSDEFTRELGVSPRRWSTLVSS